MEFIKTLQEKSKSFFGYLFLAIGSVSLFLERKTPESLINAPVTNSYIAPLLFMAIGIIILSIKDKSYKGGLFTYLGLFMGFLSLFGLSMDIEAFLQTNTFSTSSIALMCPSILFFYIGHKNHKSKLKLTPNKRLWRQPK